MHRNLISMQMKIPPKNCAEPMPALIGKYLRLYQTIAPFPIVSTAQLPPPSQGLLIYTFPRRPQEIPMAPSHQDRKKNNFHSKKQDRYHQKTSMDARPHTKKFTSPFNPIGITLDIPSKVRSVIPMEVVMRVGLLIKVLPRQSQVHRDPLLPVRGRHAFYLE